MALDTTDNKYNQQIELWQQVRAAIAGKYAVIDIVTCLPGPQYKIYNTYGKDQAAIDNANNCNAINTQRKAAYWARGRFFNATGMTHKSNNGMVWSKDPDVVLATKLGYMENNADGSGAGLREVAQKVVKDVSSIGRYGILVDMPKAEGMPTQAQQESGEMAAKLITYRAEQIFYVRAAGNSKAVDEIRLHEIKSVKKGEFDWEDKVYTRRLIIIDGIYTNELYDDKAELVEPATQPKANGKLLTEIPFQFFGADDNSPEYSEIPLYDLASANLGHFVLDCDNRDNLHYHGQGMTNIFTGMSTEAFNEANPGGLDVGAKGRNLMDADDRIEVLQIAATGAIAEEMLRDENRMVMLGAQLVQDTSSNQTLGAKEMEFGASTSTLKQITRNVSLGIEQCLDWAGMFMGDSGENKYQLNTDFVTDSMTPQMLQQHILLVQGGVLPTETLYEAARMAGLTKLDNDELKELALNDSSRISGTDEEAAIAQARLEAEGS